MFEPNEIEAMPLGIEKMFRQLQTDIMTDMVERMSVMQQMSSASDWQYQRLKAFGAGKQAVDEFVRKALEMSEQELDGVFEDFVKTGYARDRKLYDRMGRDFIPYSENKALQQLVQGIVKQTKGELTNITQSLGFAFKRNGAVQFTPLMKSYREMLDRASVQLLSGAFDYDTVLRRVVKELTDSGLRTVLYDSGHSNRVEVASRRAVLTGFHQVVGQINEDNAKTLGTDKYEVSWHSGHRPSHWWGGQWFTMQQLQSVCGLGTAEGLCGANCYHSYSPVVEGISKPTYSPEELKQMEADELKTYEYDGRSYTKYEALQRQRRLETLLRKERERIRLYESAGADEELASEKAKYFRISDEYARFSKEMHLPQQRQRVSVDGLGNIQSEKRRKIVEKSVESGIIKQKKTNRSVNYAKPIEMLDYSDISEYEPITAESIVAELEKTKIGQETLQTIGNLSEPIVFTYGEYSTGVRGEEGAGKIIIYLNNCKNTLWAARSVIHECTHYRYGIGNSQWAECVCVAQELKHARGRDKLTYSELKMVVRAVKEAYSNLSWRKGGTIYGRKKSR